MGVRFLWSVRVDVNVNEELKLLWKLIFFFFGGGGGSGWGGGGSGIGGGMVVSGWM